MTTKDRGQNFQNIASSVKGWNFVAVNVYDAENPVVGEFESFTVCFGQPSQNGGPASFWVAPRGKDCPTPEAYFAG